MLYYRRFLQISNPFYNSEQLTDEQRNAEFSGGFYIEDRDIFPCCLKVLKLNPPVDKPRDLQDVLLAARGYLAPRRFRSSFRLRLRNDPDRIQSTDIS
jgi:hypothetical protein